MTYEQAQQWRASLTAGDEVHTSRHECLARVVRTTATQLILQIGAREIRFNKKNGREVGSSSYATINPVDDSIRQRLHEKELRRRFDGLAYGSKGLAVDEISVMLEALDQLHASKAAPGGEA